MSIKHGFLALLSEAPRNGYQLRQEFEARTGETWPLNISQAYSTLQRLERDGLVEAVGDDGPGGDGRYRLTDAGRAEAAKWWLTPVKRGAPARDELAIKLALAVTVHASGGAPVDVADVIQRQRSETLRAMRDYTRLKTEPSEAGDGDAGSLSWSLVLESLIFAAEAEVRWLDHVEATVMRAAGKARRAVSAVSSSKKTRDADFAESSRPESKETPRKVGAR